MARARLGIRVACHLSQVKRANKPLRLGSALLVLALPPLLGLGPTARAEAQAEETPVFGESVEVRVVNVEVVVTDRSRQRITGLTPADFQLLVDGEPVEIDYFSEVYDADRAPLATRKERVESPPLPPDGTASAPARQAMRTNVLIFVDDVFSIHARMGLVVKNLIEQLLRLGPDDRVAVVSWTGRRLEVRSAWTSSREDTLRALQVAAAHPSRGIYYRHSPLDELEELTTAAGSALRLAGVPEGRKVLLLLAGRWPLAPLADDESALSQTSPPYPWASKSPARGWRGRSSPTGNGLRSARRPTI